MVFEGLITATEASQRSGLSPAYVRRLAQRGRLEARKFGRTWLITEESLRVLLATERALGRPRKPRRRGRPPKERS